MARSKKNLYLLLGTLLLAVVASILRAQYVPGLDPPQPRSSPYMKAPGYSGPPLSTALPTSGAFSHGLVTATPRPTGTPMGMGGGGISTAFAPPRHGNFSNIQQPQSYLPVPNITGRSMAMRAMNRGIYGSLRF